MAKRKKTPEERAALRAQLAEWAEERRQFGELIERFSSQLEERRERRERRRRLLRRFLLLRPSDR
jgi:septal ring factor EnvC (AmiA/AmiB activator)